MKIVGQCLDHLHTPPSLSQAAVLNRKITTHGYMLLRPFCWNPFASVRVLKIHGTRSNVFHTTASSVRDGTFPASSSPSPNSSNDLLQPASVSRTTATAATSPPSTTVQRVEELIEKAIYNCRFLTLMGVVGSLTGSVLCFLKGCTFVVESFREYFLGCLRGGVGTGKVVLLLVEAVDVYLMGTVMLIFGMGLYGLFISTLDVPNANVRSSNLFGLFQLTERPKWLEVRSLDELKTKLGHVIVMILLVGMFDKSKKVPVHSGLDLLCFSASILLSSGCLYLLSKLNSS